jgi:hypothetical protein
VCQRTRRIQLFNQLVMLAAQLGPFGKLVLATRSVELPADLEVICLELPLFAGGLGCREG